MDDWLQAYRAHLARERGVAANTLAGYERDLRDFAHALKRMGVTAPSGLQPHHVQSYLQGLRREGKSPATIARRLAAIRGLCRFGVIERHLSRDPTLQAETPRTPRKQPRTLTAAEIARLLEAPHPEETYGLRDKAMLELLYASGLRVSELMELDMDRVRTDLGLLYCTGPGSRERLVPVGAEAVRWVRRYAEEGRPALLRPDKPTEALFLGSQGERLTRQGFWKILRKYAEAAGLPAGLTPHVLRQSFAVHLLGNGADIRAVQEMLGHASPLTTQFYQTAARARVKEEYDRTHPRARPQDGAGGSGGTYQNIEKGTQQP